MNESYPYLRQFSRAVGIPAEKLVKAFAIERHYHTLILEEDDPEKRKRLYAEMYDQVHPLYNKTAAPPSGANPFVNTVNLFRRELQGRSILDIGCGNGAFLKCVADMLGGGRLVGLDTSSSVLPRDSHGIRFIKANIVDFDVDVPFDVVFSHHVLEHIAPSDVPSHLSSITRALVPEGRLIICMPNRLFGPSDVTRILDFTNTNRTPAMGSHVNELSYTEAIALLSKHGFTDFKTVLPVPRLKYYFPKLRLDTSLVTYIERSPRLLKLLYHVRLRSRCVARLDVDLICEKAGRA